MTIRTFEILEGTAERGPGRDLERGHRENDILGPAVRLLR